MNRIIKAKIPGKRYGFNYLLECNYCHQEFTVKGAHFNEGVGAFCSPSCKVSFYNSLNKGKKSNNWRGGKFRTPEGYILIYSPDHPFRNSTGGGYVLEHRLVMEAKIGRYLKKDEIVHHKNHVKNDNRIENLVILSNSQHSTHHYPTNMKGVVRDPLTGRFVSHKI